MSEDNLEFPGRPPEYKPHIGETPDQYVSGVTDDFTYADEDYLHRQLKRLIDEIKALKTQCEKELDDFAVPVESDDNNLQAALKREWPKDLGEQSAVISFRYYKALKVRNTTSASYIRKRYEEAVRDVNGTPAIDVLYVSDLILDEALRVQEFLNDYVGNVDDSAEERIVELFQDWVEGALLQKRDIQKVFQERESQKNAASSEVDATTPQASESQAVFQVQLNALNTQLKKDLDYLQKNFAQYAGVFYKKFLGPALNFRLGVGRNSFAATDALAEQKRSASNVTADNYRAALADQYRRNLLFTTKVDSLVGTLVRRDRARASIHALASKGKPVPNVGRTRIIRESDDKTYNISPVTTQGQNISPGHNMLEDRENPDAHPQYLHRDGGQMEGSITLGPDALIDGIKPSTHSHDGRNSARIGGGNIEPGTLPSDSIDPNDKPPVPENLRILDIRQYVVPPGTIHHEAEIAWEGIDGYQYEVSYVKVDD